MRLPIPPLYHHTSIMGKKHFAPFLCFKSSILPIVRSMGRFKANPIPSMLRLPYELIQLIIKFTNDPDLPALRLVCRALEAATFNKFTEAYLDEIQCYMLNPAALSRLQRTMTPSAYRRGIVPKINKVRLQVLPTWYYQDLDLMPTGPDSLEGLNHEDIETRRITQMESMCERSRDHTRID